MQKVTELSGSSEWRAVLVVGLVAVFVCPTTDAMMGGRVASNWMRIAFALIGLFSFAVAAFQVRHAPKRSKLTCGLWIALGALAAALNMVVALNS